MERNHNKLGGSHPAFRTPRAMPRSVPQRCREVYPSEAEGWWCIHWNSRLGFARRTVYERCRGVYPSEAEVGGGVCVPIGVSRLDFTRRTVHERCRRLYPEQSRGVYPEQSRGVYPERSRGVVVYTLEFSSRLRSTNSS